MSFLVAIDGPAGSGKSSVSKAVAHDLGFGYLDTGASYRVLTWWCVTNGVDLSDAQAVVEGLSSWGYQPPLDPGAQRHVAGGVDVTDVIREESVSSQVSNVAGHSVVRQRLNEGFRALAGSDAHSGLIVEGRDITTVVAPDAPVRILLTASEVVRMKRRELELSGAGGDLGRRDRQDRRVVNFLQAAPGVHTVDSTHLTFPQTVAAVKALIQSALEGEAHER